MAQSSSKRSTNRPGGEAATPADPHGRWAGRVVVLIALALAIAARIVAVLMAPQSSYLPDHISNMGWSTYAVQHGPWHVYDLPANQPLVVRARDSRTGRFAETVRLNAHACNYPPLSVYLFWLQGLIWHACDHDELAQRIHPGQARQLGVEPIVRSRLVNTHASRFADAFPGMVLDFVLAGGVAMLVRALRPGRRSPILEALAFAITILAPPILLDSAFWNQADSWISCVLVWCLVFLLRERLIVAGALYGAALMTKPQAILLAPVLVYVFFALRFMPGGTWRRASGLLKGAAGAVVVVAVIAAPFMIADAGSAANTEGVLRWFKRSYVGTIGAERYGRTTLSAFNLWWLDLLAQGTPQQSGDLQQFLDADARLLGVSKAVIGKVLLALGVVLAWVLCARKWRWAPQSWPVCTFVIMLAAFVLPTSVHERYIYYCLPFLIALAVCARKWIAPLVVLLVVGTFEMTAFLWARLGPQFYAADGQARSASGLLAALTVLMLLYSYAVLIPKSRELQPGRRLRAG